MAWEERGPAAGEARGPVLGASGRQQPATGPQSPPAADSHGSEKGPSQSGATNTSQGYRHSGRALLGSSSWALALTRTVDLTPSLWVHGRWPGAGQADPGRPHTLPVPDLPQGHRWVTLGLTGGSRGPEGECRAQSHTQG